MPSADARQAAFRTLFRTHYAGLCRFVARMVGSMAEAEEIVQDLFLYVWERHPLEGDGAPSRQYLYRAAHNAAVNRLRRLRLARHWIEGEASRASGEVAPSDDHELEHKELLAAVEQAVDRLPDRCRLVYLLSRREHLTYQEIAVTLDVSVKTVETQMARAFRLLRRALAPFVGSVLLALAVRG
jgi:RNA polymerase sigma-70 factor (ECF subfamily)